MQKTRRGVAAADSSALGPARSSDHPRRRLLLLAAGLGLAAAAATASPVVRAGAQPTVAHNSSCASNPPPCTKLDVPSPFVDGAAGSYAWGAATMPDGSVIIGDIWNRRVLHYDTNGNLLGTMFTQIGGDAPYGLAVDPRNSTIYVGRQFPEGVERWVESGNKYVQQGLLHASGMQYPSRVAVANDGTVYIADMLADKIFVFNGDTQQQITSATFGSRGHSTGQFLQPRGMAFDNSNPQRLYVMDSYNYRVVVLSLNSDHSLNWVTTFGKKNSPFAGTNTRGLAIDNQHSWLFTVDITANTVDKWDLTMNPPAVVQQLGSGNSTQFPPPLGQFSDGGREAAVDGAGQLWVGDMPDFRVQVFDDSSGSPIRTEPPINTPQLPPDGAFNDPRGLTLDSQGNLLVADTHNFRVEKLVPHSPPDFAWDPTNDWVIGTRGRLDPDTFAYSRNMASDPTDNSFYVADTYNNAIGHYDSNGNLLWRVPPTGTTGPFGFPSGVGVGPDRNVWVADSRHKLIVELSHVDGSMLTQFSCSPCNDPRGVAVNPSTGNIYVADMNAGLYEFSSGGTWMATIATKGSADTQLTTAPDVVVDSNYIYVPDQGADYVKVWNIANNQFVEKFRGLGPDRMKLPSAVAVDPATGWIFVAEEYNDRISAWCISNC